MSNLIHKNIELFENLINLYYYKNQEDMYELARSLDLEESFVQYINDVIYKRFQDFDLVTDAYYKGLSSYNSLVKNLITDKNLTDEYNQWLEHNAKKYKNENIHEKYINYELKLVEFLLLNGLIKHVYVDSEGQNDLNIDIYKWSSRILTDRLNLITQFFRPDQIKISRIHNEDRIFLNFGPRCLPMYIISGNNHYFAYTKDFGFFGCSECKNDYNENTKNTISSLCSYEYDKSNTASKKFLLRYEKSCEFSKRKKRSKSKRKN